MVDTLIICLRKKTEQCSFLHLWHHSTIVIVWGWVVNTWPAENSSAVYAYGAWINACVHVIMYFYYGLTAVNIRPPPALKKSVSEQGPHRRTPPIRLQSRPMWQVTQRRHAPRIPRPACSPTLALALPSLCPRSALALPPFHRSR